MTDVFNPLLMLEPQFLMGVIAQRQDFGQERSKYIGARYMPTKDVPEQTVAWETVRRENRLAGVFSSKAKAIPGDDIGFKTRFANLVWIKAAKYLDPDTVAKLRDPGMVGVYKEGGSAFTVQGIQQRVLAKMNRYLTFIDDQIEAQHEYFRLKAMQGYLRWPPIGYNGLPVTNPMPEWNADQKLEMWWPFVDDFYYTQDRQAGGRDISSLTGVAWKPGGTTRSGAGYLWSDVANSDPIKDLSVIADLMMDLRGVDADNATIIMSRKVLNAWADNAKIRDWVMGKNFEASGAQNYLDPAALKNKVKMALGYNVELYDAKWTYVDGVDSSGSEIIRSVRFLPEQRIIIVPQGENIGVLAQAPHENQTGQFVFGKSVWVKRDDLPPYERQMGVDNIAWPLLQDPEGIGVFDVL